MIRSLTLDGFRGFKHFEMHDLGRVNLIVGTNNSGKTSVLEAIQILTTDLHYSIWNTLIRRGERLIVDSDSRPRPHVDICHLFNGHIIDVGSEFRIKGINDSTQGSMTATIQERSLEEDSQTALFEEGEENINPFDLVLHGKGFVEGDAILAISRQGGLSLDALHKYRSGHGIDSPNTEFISTASMLPGEIVFKLENIALTPEENLVIKALNIIEPEIERIATTTGNQRYFRGMPGERGGVIIKTMNADQPIPIGSMGDGIWRMLGLSLALVHAANGILLIDEIDTGLHFTVMSDMWKLVNETAKRLNVQVFATTHSRDAIESLAAISHPDDDDDDENEVTIQRVEQDKAKAVAFTKQEIVIAAERGIEVR